MSAINSTAIATFFGSDQSLEHIRNDCKTNFYIKQRDPYIPRQGRYGTVSEACFKSHCKYIIKSLPLATPSQRHLFEKEVAISRAVGKAGIGPEVHDVFICMNTGFLVMDRWDGDYRSFIKKDNTYKEDDLRTIATLIQKLHRLGVIHNDLHLGNILYKTIKNKTIFGITDFGLSLRFTSHIEVLGGEDIPNPEGISPNIFFPAFDYYKLALSIETVLNIPFVSYFLQEGYLTYLEYILVEKFLYFQLNPDVPRTAKLDFLNFLKKDKITRDMRRTFPRAIEESSVWKIDDHPKKKKTSSKKKSGS
jgi:hypothetical protein